MIRTIVLKNNLQLTLRPSEPEDAERILAFIEQSSGESENITFGPGEFKKTVEEERQYFRQFAQSETRLALVAEIAGEVVGTLNFSSGARPRIQHVGDFGIMVARKYWNAGVGSQLLKYLTDWARQTSIIRKINLHVRVDNLPAIHLYERFGFVHEGRVTRELYLHGEFIDGYIMSQHIDPLDEKSRDV